MARPLIADPKAIPVVATDDHLPALEPSRLHPEAVRRRFASPEPWEPAIPGDVRRLSGSGSAASVLVPLVRRGDGLSVLLTQRTAHLRDHAGQVSFPGGRVEEGDADEIETALREAEEEVGLARARVEVIGRLPVYMTVTNYVVTPIVAFVQPPFELRLDAFEVAEAFEVPLQFLMTPAHHRRHDFEFQGQRRQFLSMPWHGVGSRGEPREYFIWGATAAMLRNLYHFLAD